MSRPTVAVDGATIEYVDLPGVEPALVFLHEGLGSIELWRSFPNDVRAATGRRTVVYSRPGYGRSTPVPPPWPVTYMHDHALGCSRCCWRAWPSSGPCSSATATAPRSP